MSSESKESDQRISIDREFVVNQLIELEIFEENWPTNWLGFMRQFLAQLGNVCSRCAGKGKYENGIGQEYICAFCSGTGTDK